MLRVVSRNGIHIRNKLCSVKRGSNASAKRIHTGQPAKSALPDNIRIFYQFGKFSACLNTTLILSSGRLTK